MLSSLPLPAFQEAHIWQLYLPLAQSYCDQWHNWLSPDEQERAQKFIRASDRDRFLLSRGGLRYLLACYLNYSPIAITFRYTPYGKPELVSPAFPMAFNLAHSGRWVVYGMSLASCLGVDVETITPRACLESLIDRCLTPHEIAVLPTKPAARLRAFYQHWSIKEAHLKAVGLGISYPMSQVHIGWHPTLHLKQPAIAPHVALNDWTVQVWNLSEDVVAAACIGASYHRLLIQPFPLPSSS